MIVYSAGYFAEGAFLIISHRLCMIDAWKVCKNHEKHEKYDRWMYDACIIIYAKSCFTQCMLNLIPMKFNVDILLFFMMHENVVYDTNDPLGTS